MPGPVIMTNGLNIDRRSLFWMIVIFVVTTAVDLPGLLDTAMFDQPLPPPPRVRQTGSPGVPLACLGQDNEAQLFVVPVPRPLSMSNQLCYLVRKRLRFIPSRKHTHHIQALTSLCSPRRQTRPQARQPQQRQDEAPWWSGHWFWEPIMPYIGVGIPALMFFGVFNLLYEVQSALHPWKNLLCAAWAESAIFSATPALLTLLRPAVPYPTPQAQRRGWLRNITLWLTRNVPGFVAFMGWLEAALGGQQGGRAGRRQNGTYEQRFTRVGPGHLPALLHPATPPGPKALWSLAELMGPSPLRPCIACPLLSHGRMCRPPRTGAASRRPANCAPCPSPAAQVANAILAAPTEVFKTRDELMKLSPHDLKVGMAAPRAVSSPLCLARAGLVSNCLSAVEIPHPLSA